MKYNKEDLKKEFIKSFGQLKWESEELLERLWPDIVKICSYLGVEPIPVVMDDFTDDARYMIKGNYIIISSRLVDDEIEVKKCLIHELRHYYQLICIEHRIGNELLRKAWIEDLKRDYMRLDQGERLCLSIELDAYAFTKYLMKKMYNLDCPYPVDFYDRLIDEYISKYLID